MVTNAVRLIGLVLLLYIVCGTSGAYSFTCVKVILHERTQVPVFMLQFSTPMIAGVATTYDIYLGQAGLIKYWCIYSGCEDKR